MNFMQMQLNKDKKLLDFFMKNNLTGKADIVKERIATIQAELSGS